MKKNKGNATSTLQKTLDSQDQAKVSEVTEIRVTLLNSKSIGNIDTVSENRIIKTIKVMLPLLYRNPRLPRTHRDQVKVSEVTEIRVTLLTLK